MTGAIIAAIFATLASRVPRCAILYLPFTNLHSLVTNNILYFYTLLKHWRQYIVFSAPFPSLDPFFNFFLFYSFWWKWTTCFLNVIIWKEWNQQWMDAAIASIYFNVSKAWYILLLWTICPTPPMTNRFKLNSQILIRSALIHSMTMSTDWFSKPIRWWVQWKM